MRIRAQDHVCAYSKREFLIKKFLKYLSMSLLVALLGFGLYYPFRGDPIFMIAGQALTGNEVEYPDNWSFTDAHTTIMVETNPVDPHSVTTLCFTSSDGADLFVPAMDGHTKSWPALALADNRARIKIADEVYPVLLELVTKDAMISQLAPMARRKFPDLDLPDPESAPKNIWLFKVQPRISG